MKKLIALLVCGTGLLVWAAGYTGVTLFDASRMRLVLPSVGGVASGTITNAYGALGPGMTLLDLTDQAVSNWFTQPTLVSASNVVFQFGFQTAPSTGSLQIVGAGTAAANGSYQ